MHWPFSLSPLEHGAFVFVGLLLYVMVTRIGKQRRQPSAALAWVMSIALLPYLGIPLFLAFGTRKLARARRRALARVPAPRGVDGPDWALTLLAALGVPQPMRNASVDFHGDGEAALRELLALIDGARDYVDLCTFVLADDLVGDAVSAALARAAGRGVQVRVLLDAIGGLRTPRRLARQLRAGALADGAGAALVEFPLFELGSAFDVALVDVAERHQRRVAETDRHERAFLTSGLTEDEYLTAHIRKKKRKEFNRLWNRLSELGELRFAVHDGGNVDAWLNRFLKLEAGGWKGKRGTALKADAEHRAFFEKLCRGAASQGKLHCTEITLDGKPLAMLTSFRAGDGLYTFKIAFDETYARYSPGVLLMLKLIGEVLRDERTAWADSCAIPGHPMIDHIWAERREMRSVLIAGSGPFAAPALRHAATAIKLTGKLRAALRKHYHAFRKERENDQND